MSAEAVILVKRFELALDKFHGAYADPYADAEDRGDARRKLNEARAALVAGLKKVDEAYAEGRADEASDWNNVGRNGPPPCEGYGGPVFVGINTAGFACCFNEVTHDGVCSMQGPELSTVQMSGLEWWCVLSLPSEATA